MCQAYGAVDKKHDGETKESVCSPQAKLKVTLPKLTSNAQWSWKPFSVTGNLIALLAMLVVANIIILILNFLKSRWW